MALTNERAEVLAMHLTDKTEDGYNPLDLDASEVAEKDQCGRNDFTTEELHEFVDMMEQSAPAGDDLDESSLVGLSGGVVAAAVAAFANGYYIYSKNKKRRW